MIKLLYAAALERWLVFSRKKSGAPLFELKTTPPKPNSAKEPAQNRRAAEQQFNDLGLSAHAFGPDSNSNSNNQSDNTGFMALRSSSNLV